MSTGANVEGHQRTNADWKGRLRKLGWVGFLFFLLKGIIWLVIGYLIVR